MNGMHEYRWVSASAIVGCLIGALVVAAQNVSTDAEIQRRVEARLVGDEVLRDLEVRADHQAVTLKGTLASRDDRSRAIRLTHEIDGVRWVIADIVIDPDPAGGGRAGRTAASADGPVTLSEIRLRAIRACMPERKP